MFKGILFKLMISILGVFVGYVLAYSTLELMYISEFYTFWKKNYIEIKDHNLEFRREVLNAMDNVIIIHNIIKELPLNELIDLLVDDLNDNTIRIQKLFKAIGESSYWISNIKMNYYPVNNNDFNAFILPEFKFEPLLDSEGNELEQKKQKLLISKEILMRNTMGISSNNPFSLTRKKEQVLQLLNI